MIDLRLENDLTLLLLILGLMQLFNFLWKTYFAEKAVKINP